MPAAFWAGMEGVRAIQTLMSNRSDWRSIHGLD
jgi:hypothetical protein